MPRKGYRKGYLYQEPPGQRYCVFHKALHPLEEFPPGSGGKPSSWYRPAYTEYRRKEREGVPRAHGSQAYRRIKVLQGYGAKCAACGNTDPLVLQLDHVDPELARQQKALCKERGRKFSTFAYEDAIARNYPDTYQILCSNCNSRKRLDVGGRAEWYAEMLKKE